MTTTPTTASLVTNKPTDEEIDVYGLTHPGKARKTNQDHFLICSLKRQIALHGTSLPNIGDLEVDPQRMAFLAMVADGVGSMDKAGEASKRAVARITRYIWNVLMTYYTSDSADEEAFASALADTTLRVHNEIESESATNDDLQGMATTLTLWIGVWPKAYLIQVGDSRYYSLRNGVLTQHTRDQTIAQEFIDQGILTREDAERSRLKHQLSSSIGGPQSAPVVTSMDQDWNNVGLLCTDGLTKHVSDDRIREILLNMTSSRQAAETLLQEALDGGGSDNITIIVGRDVRKQS